MKMPSGIVDVRVTIDFTTKEMNGSNPHTHRVEIDDPELVRRAISCAATRWSTLTFMAYNALEQLLDQEPESDVKEPAQKDKDNASGE